LINTLNSYNNQHIYMPDLYNLPNNGYICSQISFFEHSDNNSLPWCVREFLIDLPLNWLSKVTSKFDAFDNDILIVDDCDLLDSIKPYITSYYTKRNIYSNKYEYKPCIYKNINREKCEKISLYDYLKALDNQGDSSFYEGSYPIFWNDDVWVHIFDGIRLYDFYQIYFKSGLSKEIIFRF